MDIWLHIGGCFSDPLVLTSSPQINWLKKSYILPHFLFGTVSLDGAGNEILEVPFEKLARQGVLT